MKNQRHTDHLSKLKSTVFLFDKGRLHPLKGVQHTPPSSSQLKTEKGLVYSARKIGQPGPGRKRVLSIRVSDQGLITGEQLLAQIRQASGFVI